MMHKICFGEKKVLKDFNLLITTSRGNEDNTCSEILNLLGEIGDAAVTVDKTGITGLIVAKTAFSPFEIIEKFRGILKERPWDFRYTLRVIPIEKVVPTDLREIERIATELASKIKENETFRVTVEKRFTKISSKDIVEAAAANIERRVNMTSPDKFVLIEVIGGFTGISVIESTDILSVIKERM
jgi:tRNA acetyltransferase TAN1